MNSRLEMNGEKIRQRLKRTINPSGDYIGELFRILAGNDAKLNSVQRSELMNCAIKYVGSLLCVMFVAAIIYVASIDSKTLTNRHFTYSVLTILPIIVGSILITPVFKAGTSVISSALYLIGFLGAMLAVYYSIKYLIAANNVIANYSIVVMIGFVVILSLSMVYRILHKTLKNVSGWKGFAIKLVFYLPCLLLDLVEYFIQDYNNTPKTVFIIFVIQVVVIILYFIVNYLMRKFIDGTRIKLLDKPIHLTREYRIGDNDTIRSHNFVQNYAFKRLDQTSPNGDSGDEYLKNYSISMWVFVNPINEPLRYDIPIFKYGNGVVGNGRGKPYLVYNAGNGETPYTIYYSDNDKANKAKYSFDMPIQKWNNVVITYKDSTADLFINGELIHSFEFEPVNAVGGDTPLPMYSKYDVITVGYGNTNKKTVGLNGAICNVSYYRVPLKDTEIAANYMLMANKNPPL